VVTTTGSYSATAPLSGGDWIMQLVAFKAAQDASSCTCISLAKPTGNALSYARENAVSLVSGIDLALLVRNKNG